MEVFINSTAGQSPFHKLDWLIGVVDNLNLMHVEVGEVPSLQHIGLVVVIDHIVLVTEVVSGVNEKTSGHSYL